MSIYEKIQQVRVGLSNERIVKTGKNTFSGYEYYELKDFLFHVNRLCLEHKITPIVDFGNKEYVTLTIYDFDNPDEKIVFSSPNVEANVKGAQTIQNLGATETYQRRYLYLMAFEIAENDIVNTLEPNKANQGSRADQQQSNNQDNALKNERRLIWSEAKKSGLSGDDVKRLMEYKFGTNDSMKLTMEQAAELRKNIDAYWEEIVKAKVEENPDDDVALEKALDEAKEDQQSE